ncbi:MAG: TonB-dependent receptor, partial [Betaproteobacteria bacterium]|nr:TonB-dependent receptor [Betaproteobacteria bacterium]
MTSSRLAPWALSLALTAAARVAAAQSSGTLTPPPLALDPVVVTASRTAQTIDAALPDTQVITRSDIDRSGAGDIAELLRMLSAVDVSQSGGPGKLTSLFIRGGDSRHTLVLLDGVPLNKADFGAASIEHLPLDQIDRIEIVRGNLSSLYGSQAMGGVVQIFTRQGAGTSATLTAGSRATAAASAHLGRQIGDTRLALTLAHQQTDGVSAQNPATYPGADPDRDGYRNDSAALDLTHTLAAGHRVGLQLLGVYARNPYDNAFATSPHPVSTHHLDTWALSSRDQINEMWLSELRVSSLHERFDDPSAYTTAGVNRTTQASWSNTLALTRGQSVQLGLETQRSSFDDTPSSGYTPRDTHSLRLGYVGEQQAFDWQLDARYDRTSDVGTATTGYAGVGYKLDARWKLIASASTSFAAPTFIDLLYADPTAPRLRPERGRSVELGVQFSTPQLRARVTVFDARIRDKVDFDPVTFYSS